MMDGFFDEDDMAVERGCFSCALLVAFFLFIVIAGIGAGVAVFQWLTG